MKFRSLFGPGCLLLLLLLQQACVPQNNQHLGSRQIQSDPFAVQRGDRPGAVRHRQQAAGEDQAPDKGQSSASEKAGSQDINQDLTQPLEKEVTEAPPRPESYEIGPMDKEAVKALQSEPEIDFELDIKETKTLEYYFEFYTKTNHTSFQRWLKRAEPFLPYIRKVFTEKGLPQDLVFLPFAESGFNPWAYSRAGAAGLWQFIPGTARMYDLDVNWWIDERRDPYLSTIAAANYLSTLHERFQDWYLALAAYNCGEGRVSRALKRSEGSSYYDISQSHRYLAQETRNYIPKFLAILKIVRNLESLGFEPLDWGAPKTPNRIAVKGGTDLLALTRHLGLDWDAFRKMNPAFRRQASPPDRDCPIYLESRLISRARAFLDSPQATPFSGYHRYQVRRGDSWWRLSQRFQVPVAVLKQANQTRSNLLRTGQWLLIPGSARTILANQGQEQRSASYRVQKGDSLWTIARRFGVSVNALRRANRNALQDRYLHIGQQLSIPGIQARASEPSRDRRRTNYTIQKGDTLWELSQRYQVSLQTLRTANGLGPGSVLQVGSQLFIPDITPDQTRQARKRAAAAHQKILQYYVRKGDNLWNISNRFNISLQTLLAANDLSQGDVLHIGKQLQIPVPDEKSAPPAEPATTDRKHVEFYTIKPGDTLWAIARRFEVSVADLRSWNSLDADHLLRPGQSVKIIFK